jgi:hypothetical protein
LARLHGVADAERALEQPPVDPERLVDFALRLDRAGQQERAAPCAARRVRLQALSVRNSLIR